MKLVCDLVNADIQIGLDIPLRDAIYELMAATLEADNSKITIEPKYLRCLCDALTKENKDNFALDLYEFVAQPDKQLTSKFWSLFKDDLQIGLLTLGTKGMPLRRLVKPLVINNDKEGLQWFIGLLKSRNLSEIDDDKKSKNDVIKIIKSLLQRDGVEAEFAIQLKQLLGLLNRRKRL